MSDDATHCYIGRCRCGKIIFACVDDPAHSKDTAASVAEVIRDGFSVERGELDVARNGEWCHDSKQHMRGLHLPRTGT